MSISTDRCNLSKTSCILPPKVTNMSKVKNSFFILLILCGSHVLGQGSRVITGTIKDQANQESLPFATVNLKGTSIGTISNATGEFVFKCPNVDGAILFSFIGYHSLEIPLSDIGERPLEITLEPSFIELNELIVRPLSAEQYMRRVVRKFVDNYANEPFETRAYYREKFIENDKPIQYSEGFFKTYYPDFQNDSTLHQLLLYRRADDLRDIAFMERTRLKKEAKERRKAKKNGEEYDEENSDSDIISVAFGGPKEVISDDPVIGPEDFLDTLKFKKYKYEYGENSSYQGRKLLTVNFKTRGKVEHIKQSGKILIDENSDAIVSVEYDGKFVVPLWAKPILFAFGLAIESPRFLKKVRYQEIDGRWYPENIMMQADIGLTKRYMFKSNDKSDFDIEQVFFVQSINTESPQVIAEENQFDADEEIEEQVVELDGLDWTKVNVLRVESDFVGAN